MLWTYFIHIKSQVADIVQHYLLAVYYVYLYDIFIMILAVSAHLKIFSHPHKSDKTISTSTTNYY